MAKKKRGKKGPTDFLKELTIEERYKVLVKVLERIHRLRQEGKWETPNDKYARRQRERRRKGGK